ncbi:uncharacterized protein LOC143902160 isoform X1 [Temnothorax americanus]|uniref:uncharacterized protein LOC143902160 isoform X1 n=1 Tax=Temnothorax americanus TaxID=1964332 RepID=UPI004067DB42
MSLMSYRKCCVGKRQLYRRIANEKVTFFKELIVSNSQEHNQEKNVKRDKIEKYYNKNEEIVSNDTSDDDIGTFDIERTENQSSLNLSCELDNVIGNIEDESTSDSNLCKLIRHWAVIKHNISHSALTDLLHILHHFHPELPLTSKSLLETPVSINTKKLDTGEYCHIGLTQSLQNIAKFHVGNTIELSFNIDGLPLFNSTNKHLWPILGLVKNVQNMSLFVIGIFYGGSKPSPLHLYLEDFITELSLLLKNGLQVNDRYFDIKIHSFVCDAPARAYIKQVKNHNGYSCCEKCEESGIYFERRIILRNTNARRRTDESFVLQRDEDHHVGISPLLELKIGMVTQFLLDYMHGVCLGVTKKLLHTWISGKSNVKLGHRLTDLLSKKLVALGSFMPSEFNRKPRSLTDLCRWKATEFRSFLLYLGPVVLRDILDISVYEHFLLFHSAISILTLKHNINNLGLSLAQELLETFINYAEKIYGLEFYVYNVHILCHLTSDVQMYGPLDNWSCFPYENYLGSLKKLVKSSRKPLQQVCRRLHEIFLSNPYQEPNHPILKHFLEHNNGPLLSVINIFKQFKKISIRDYVLSTYSHCFADSHFLSKNNEVVQINNIILTTNGSTKLIGKQYISSESLYLYPFDSKKLNIFCVTKLSEQLQAWDIDDIKAKCVLLPLKHDKNWVCFPLLHI